MNLRVYSEPAIEPVSVQELKEHLRLDSGYFGDNLTTRQVIPPGAKVVTVGYALVGSYVDVLGLSAVMVLDVGQVAAGGSVEAKIQESDDHVGWSDWPGGSFPQVTQANANAIFKIAYTGVKQFIRVVAQILIAGAELGASCLTYSADDTDDAQLAMAIAAARQQVEAYTRRALISQTWEMALDSWPSRGDHDERWRRNSGEVVLPLGQLQSIASVICTDATGDSTTLTATTDYLVDSFSDPGRLVLPPGGSWPSSSLYPVNPIKIRFVCGYGGVATSVPAAIRVAILMLAADLYENREAQVEAGGAKALVENKTVANLLGRYCIRSFG